MHLDSQSLGWVPGRPYPALQGCRSDPGSTVAQSAIAAGFEVIAIDALGHVGRQWTDWFEGLTIALEEDGDTLLTGPVFDQAALHGLLKKVRDLGIPLISVNRAGPDQADASDVKEQIEASCLFNKTQRRRTK